MTVSYNAAKARILAALPAGAAVRADTLARAIWGRLGPSCDAAAATAILKRMERDGLVRNTTAGWRHA